MANPQVRLTIINTKLPAIVHPRGLTSFKTSGITFVSRGLFTFASRSFLTDPELLPIWSVDPTRSLYADSEGRHVGWLGLPFAVADFVVPKKSIFCRYILSG